NINSQAMNSANLARETLDVLEHYLALALLCGVQAVELRAQLVEGSYDARGLLSPATAALYEAARTAAAGAPDATRPIHLNDLGGFLQPKVEGLLGDISSRGATFEAVAPTRAALREFVA